MSTKTVVWRDEHDPDTYHFGCCYADATIRCWFTVCHDGVVEMFGSSIADKIFGGLYDDGPVSIDLHKDVVDVVLSGELGQMIEEWEPLWPGDDYLPVGLGVKEALRQWLTKEGLFIYPHGVTRVPDEMILQVAQSIEKSP